MKIHITHTLGMYPVRVTLPQGLNNTLLVKVPQLLKYIYMVKYTFSCLMCPDEGHHYLQTSVSAYDIQFHHCHQCSVESYHNGRKSGYTDHCCTGMLHFDRKLQKLEERCLQLLGYKNWKTLETMRNLLQLHSSVPSEHVRFPSHREEEEMHWPLAHRNWVELQPIMYSMYVTEYRYVTCMLQHVISYSDK